MQGTMLWFNRDKGCGFIRTEDGERLYVARSAFRPDHEPQPRCKGLEVSFHRQEREGDICAVEVTFSNREQTKTRRARLRAPRGGHPIA